MATNVITTRRDDILAGRAPSSSSRLRELVGRLQNWLDRRRRYRTTVRELSALSDHVLADIGIARDQIEGVARQLASKPGTWRR